MRILVLTKFYHPRIGGVETTVKLLSENFVGRGHEVTVVCMDHELRGEETINGVKVVRLPSDTKLLAGVNRSIWRYLTANVRTGDFDVVHVHSYHILLSMEGALLFKMRGIPYVFSGHYHGKGHTPFRDLLFKAYHPMGALVLRRAERIFCVSKCEMALLTRDFKDLEDRITVIPSGIKDFPKIDVKRDPDRLLYIGRLMAYKGVDAVITALAELRSRGRTFKLHVVGQGPHEAALRSLVDRTEMSDLVTFLGDVPEDRINREYREAGLFVLLSGAEAYGLVVAEALSCGTPCLVSKEEALVEFLDEPGVFGVDFPPNPVAVANQIMEISNHLDQIKVGPFSDKIAPWSTIADLYLQEYERCIARRIQSPSDH
jgi:glycosyltransferase involved in cell wall biosynthesis